ncbi:hypothetical protein D7X33_39640 [Butyricicoccus sp. 1XD8-22]|nr:hypothetical protein D7X33_39640 [Butyricicoccus sp. 1XD8-22]
MPWETYKPVRNTRASLEPKITIKNGKFSFNAFVRDNFIKDFSFITLLFDKKTNKVGMQLKEKEDDMTIKIAKASKGNTTFLNATPFFRIYGINDKETTSYSAEFDEKNKIITIDLNKAEKVNYSPRTQNKQGTQEVQFTIKPQQQSDKKEELASGNK